MEVPIIYSDDIGSSQPRSAVMTYRNDVLVALAVVAGLLLIGVLVGVVWEWIATPAQEVVTAGTSGGSIFADQDAERWTSADGWFAVLGVAAGLMTTAVAYGLFRRRSIAVTLGVTLGGLAGSVVASQVGEALGPPPVASHAGAAPGTAFTGPLVIHAPGVLYTWPIAAAMLILALTAMLDRDRASRRGEPGQW